MSNLPPMARLTPDFAAGPQPEVDDMAALAAAGFRSVICNRPDDEVPPGARAADMEAAARAAGLAFAAVEVTHAGIDLDLVEAQRRALASLPGPHFGYCAGGFRSSLIWALAQAGDRPAAEILSALARAGFGVPGLGAQIEALAAARRTDAG